MAVYLSSYITVGDFSWTGICDVKISKSINSFRDTATITLPSQVTVTSADGKTQNSYTTANLFKVGDPIAIQLGYDGALTEEFRGFVTRPNLKEPFELECEGYSYQLQRTKPISAGTEVKLLPDLLKLLVEGTDITIHADTPKDTKLGGLSINGKNAADALEQLCSTKIFCAYFIDGNQLYVGPKDLADLPSSKYWLGWNTLPDSQLKYREKEETKVLLSITYKDDAGKTHHFTDGEEGGLTISYNAKRLSKEQALAEAKRKADSYWYEGYEGKIKTFLQPYAAPGWRAHIEEAEHAARTGNYLIEDMQLTFGTDGAYRTLQLSKKISK